MNLTNEGKNLFFKTIFEDIALGVALIDRKYKFKQVNPFLCKLLKYSYSELLKLSFEDILIKEFLSQVCKGVEHIFRRDHKTFNKEIILRKKDSEEIWVKINFFAPSDFIKSLDGVIMTCENISLRKKVEKELLKSEKKFKSLFEQSNDAILITNEKGRLLEFNKKACEKTGYQSEQLLKMEFKDFFDEKNAKAFENYMSRITTNGNSHYVTSYKNKTNHQVKVNSNSIFFEDSHIFLHILGDVTERNKSQQNIINAIMVTEEKERLRFSRDLHDGLGPLLSATKMYIKSLDLIKDKAKQKDAINKTLDIIDEAVSVIKEIAGDLSPHVLRDFGLVTALKNQFNKLKAGKNIKLSINSKFRDKIDENLEISLFRIFEELFNNTLKHANAQNINIDMVQLSQTLRILYSDDGKGFDLKDVLINGRGNGVRNMYSRIEVMNGKIDVKSKKGEGTQVHIWIDLN